MSEHDPIEVEEAFDAMEKWYPSALRAYRTSFEKGTITSSMFYDLVLEFMKQPSYERASAEKQIRDEMKPADTPAGIYEFARAHPSDGSVFGLDRRPRQPIRTTRCGRCGDVFVDEDKPDRCMRCGYIFGAGRKPAFEGPQEKARLGATYHRLQDPARDVVVIMCVENETRRIIELDGKAWHLFSRRTNAPMGEVAITDDDLETILTHAPEAEEFVTPKLRRWRKHLEFESLVRLLFLSDPRVVDHVIKNDRNLVDGIRRAWELAHEPHCHEPERSWMKEAEKRAAIMLANQDTIP